MVIRAVFFFAYHFAYQSSHLYRQGEQGEKWKRQGEKRIKLLSIYFSENIYSSSAIIAAAVFDSPSFLTQIDFSDAILLVPLMNLAKTANPVLSSENDEKKLPTSKLSIQVFFQLER